MKRLAQLLAFVIGLTALNVTPAHAYGNNQVVSVTIDVDSNTGWWDDWIWQKDPGTTYQTRCPRLAFWPSPGLQYNTYPQSYTYAVAPGQNPVNGYQVLTHCLYAVTFSMPAYQPYAIDVYPLCGSTANMAIYSRIAHFAGTAGDSWSPTKYYSGSIAAPYRNKSYWRSVISQCGLSTAYYDYTTVLSFTYGGVPYYSVWY